ncbi:MAG: PilZ domain-containing protein [Planctomycetales bacterium]
MRLFRRSLDWGFHAGRGASAIAAEAESPAWAESETRPVEEIGSPQPHAAGLEADGARRARSERERRAFPRRESICLVSVYRQHDDGPVNQQEVRWLLHSSPLKGAIDDISMNGVAFLLHETIEPGTHLLMRLVNRRLDRHFDTSGRVVRAIPDGLGEWKIVCRFDRNLSLDQVHEYGQNVFASELV